MGVVSVQCAAWFHVLLVVHFTRQIASESRQEKMSVGVAENASVMEVPRSSQKESGIHKSGMRKSQLRDSSVACLVSVCSCGCERRQCGVQPSFMFCRLFTS